MHFEVNSEGEVFYNRENIGTDGIADIMARQRDGGDPVPVILKGDGKTAHEHMIRVINAATAAGAKSVSLQTKNKK